MEYGLQKDYTLWITDNKTVPMQVLPTQVLPTEVVPTTVIPDTVLPAQDKGTTSTGTPSVSEGTTSTGSNKRHIKDIITKDIYSHWNNKKIVVHLKLNEKIERKIKSVLSDYGESDVIKAIDNYAEILTHPELYYWTHRWTLVDFLQRGLEKFMDNADPLNNFKTKKENKETNSQPDKYSGLVKK